MSPRERFVRAMALDAVSGLALMMKKAVPSTAHARGFALYLSYAVRDVWSRPTARDVAARAWGRDLKPSTLSNRFLYNGLPRPQRWLMALRAAAVSHAIATGLTLDEIAWLLQADPLLARGSMTASDPRHRPARILWPHAATHDLTWGWRMFVAPLLRQTPRRAWTSPALVSPTAPHTIERRQTDHGH